MSRRRRAAVVRHRGADVVGDRGHRRSAPWSTCLEAHRRAARLRRLAIDHGDAQFFGTTDGLALYLDGDGLPPEVYAANDVNELLDAPARRARRDRRPAVVLGGAGHDRALPLRPVGRARWRRRWRSSLVDAPARRAATASSASPCPTHGSATNRPGFLAPRCVRRDQGLVRTSLPTTSPEASRSKAARASRRSNVASIVGRTPVSTSSDDAAPRARRACPWSSRRR